MSVRYYALADPPSEVRGLFREIRTPEALQLEYYSRDRGWVADSSLSSYTMRGEAGAEEISEEQAQEIVSRWSRDLSTTALLDRVAEAFHRAVVSLRQKDEPAALALEDASTLFRQLAARSKSADVASTAHALEHK